MDAVTNKIILKQCRRKLRIFIAQSADRMVILMGFSVLTLLLVYLAFIRELSCVACLYHVISSVFSVYFLIILRIFLTWLGWGLDHNPQRWSSAGWWVGRQKLKWDWAGHVWVPQGVKRQRGRPRQRCWDELTRILLTGRDGAQQWDPTD